MPLPTPPDNATTDRILGGRVLYRQPRLGFRAALDPVLLAAAVPACPGDRVLEGGTGAGAALLCLAARVPGLIGTGIDRDPAMVRLAQENAALNVWPGLTFVAADLAASPVRGQFDHAFANPPYHAPDGTASPVAAREAAKRGAHDLLAVWAAALSGPLRHRGTLTLILPPGLLETALTALRAAGSPCERLVPIWTAKGRPARWVVVRGRKNGRTPLAIAPGLVLHDASRGFSPGAEAILRGGGPLE